MKPGILGLLGPNGAGKSTFMRMLATITKPTDGTIIWNGTNVVKSPDTLRDVLGYLPQDFGVYPNLNDRFDPSRNKPRRIKNAASDSTPAPTSTSQALPAFHLTPLNKTANRYSFFNVLMAEVKLLLKGQRWWWYVIMAGMMIACLVAPFSAVREFAFPIAWIWPILVWSAIGNREVHNNVQQLTFSSASPLLRQLPAQWLAGFIVTLLISIGTILPFTIDGDTTGLLALLSGAFFIPSLALASGVWSGSSKLFEILYMLIWYLGPVNELMAPDYIGSHGNGRPEFFIPFSIALIVIAFIGRTRQIRT